MKRNMIEAASIAAAALVLGIMAGFFATYTFNVNLAMQQVDAQTYATVQSLFNKNVRHILFFIFFFGGGAAPVLALVVNYRHYRTMAFRLVALAAILYVAGVILLTSNVNLPLNRITEAWNPMAMPSDWQATRDAWNVANAWRVAASFSAFLLCLAALTGRAGKSTS